MVTDNDYYLGTNEYGGVIAIYRVSAPNKREPVRITANGLTSSQAEMLLIYIRRVLGRITVDLKPVEWLDTNEAALYQQVQILVSNSGQWEESNLSPGRRALIIVSESLGRPIVMVASE